ncbi:MAG TPA: NAD-dependent epimerase/dehydratase family protein [Candidatus Polarisedimenticolia bacterium]|jgi:farnesol dehydrogenase
MKIFMTGATGFLGMRVAARLAEAGHDVRALVRPSQVPRPMPPGVTTTPGDVTDAASLERGAAGCDVIVHSAALVKMWVRDRGSFDRVNVGGLRNILEAGRRARVSRILYTSSFIALGPTDGRVADETWVHAPAGHHNDYERTKAAADLVAREAAAAGAPLVTVYPGVVYGAGRMTDGSLMTKTIHDFMRRRVPGYLGSGRQVICYAYIDDVVEGHLLALERGAPGRSYILGGPNADYFELYGLLARLSGAPAPTRHLPFWLMGLAGKLLRWRADYFGIEPPITDEVIEIYRHDWAYASERAVSELGYRITPLEEGLRRTIEWLRSAAS